MAPPPLHLAEALGHEATDKRFDILRRIGEVGSISEAARGAGVSYKAAWQAVETLSNLAGTTLVDKAVGGTGGGGAILTEAGQQLLRAFDLLGAARQDVLDRLAREGVRGAPMPAGLAALGLRTSMRNQLPCRVQALKAQGPSMRVELVLAAGSTLRARITRESAELLGLRAGLVVLALCKATAVEVAASIAPRAGQNLLQGRVTRGSGATGGEMSIALDDGPQLVGFAAPRHGLKLHGRAMACVEESGVVVAVSG